MRNQDLSLKVGSLIDDQGITFSIDRKVIDEMKELYQSSLKAAAAPGGDPGDDGDDESDKQPGSNPLKNGRSPGKQILAMETIANTVVIEGDQLDLMEACQVIQMMQEMAEVEMIIIQTTHAEALVREGTQTAITIGTEDTLYQWQYIHDIIPQV